MAKHWHIDIEELRALWLQGLHAEDIATRLKTTVAMVHKLRNDHKMPARQRVCRQHIADPTPEEIEQRKQEIKERHFAAMRAL